MCNFRYDPHQWPGGSGEATTCPYQPVEGKNFCIFHLTPRQRQFLFRSQAEINNKFIQTIVGGEMPIITIFCTTIRAASLSTVMKAIPPETDIELTHTYVLGELDLSEAEIHSRISIADCYIAEIDISQSTLEKGIRIRDSQIDNFRANATVFERQCRFEEINFGMVVIQSSEFKREVKFHGTTFEDIPIKDVREEVGDRTCSFRETAMFMGTKFNRGVLFDGATFEEAALFGYSEFKEGGSFYDITASTGVDFNNAEFHGHTTFALSDLGIAAFLDCNFDKSVSFEGATLGNDYTNIMARIESGEDVPVDTIHEIALSHKKAIENEFVEHYTDEMGVAAAIFNRANVNGRTNMLDTKLRGGIRSEYADFEYLEVRFESSLETTTSLFHQSKIHRGIIHIDDKNCYIELRNTTFGSVEINTESENNPFANLYIDGTNFDGFEFSNYRAELEDINWEIDGAYVGEDYVPPMRREATYSKAKAGAAQLGDRTAESKFSILEGRYRRKRYWNDLRGASSLKSFLSNIYKTGVNITYDILSKYGESPQRVFSWSIFITILFSLIYNASIEWPNAHTLQISSREFTFELGYSVESYVLSVQSFTSFIVGQPSRDLSLWIELVTSVESFLGAFFIALFVATVVRKIKR